MEQPFHFFTTVSNNHDLHLTLPDNMRGKKVEVFVMPLTQLNLADESRQLMKLQENSGYYTQVIGSEAEDCWNNVL